MSAKLHLPLALVDLLLQALQVGLEGLVELRQLGILFKVRLELSNNSTSVYDSNVRTRVLLSATYLQEILELFLHADNSSVLQFLMGGSRGVFVNVEIYDTIFTFSH